MEDDYTVDLPIFTDNFMDVFDMDCGDSVNSFEDHYAFVKPSAFTPSAVSRPSHPENEPIEYNSGYNAEDDEFLIEPDCTCDECMGNAKEYDNFDSVPYYYNNTPTTASTNTTILETPNTTASSVTSVNNSPIIKNPPLPQKAIDLTIPKTIETPAVVAGPTTGNYKSATIKTPTPIPVPKKVPTRKDSLTEPSVSKYNTFIVPEFQHDVICNTLERGIADNERIIEQIKYDLIKKTNEISILTLRLAALDENQRNLKSLMSRLRNN
jgi:hypothetical protein